MTYRCTEIYAMKICINDIIDVMLRHRSALIVSGRVVDFSFSSIVIETETSIISVRISEIKTITKRKQHHHEKRKEEAEDDV